MSLAPDHDLIKACMGALKGDPQLAQLVGNRIVDRPDDKPAASEDMSSPYISLGPTSSVPEDVECIDAVGVTIQFDVWSWGAGEAYSTVECRTIVERIRRVLHGAELTLESNRLASLEYELSRVGRDRDGITSHGVIQLTGVVETL